MIIEVLEKVVAENLPNAKPSPERNCAARCYTRAKSGTHFYVDDLGARTSIVQSM